MAEFEDIYETDYPIVYRYVLSLCRNGPTAEEITQEAFVKAMEHLDRFDGKCRRYVWICQIAKNTYFTDLKKRKRLLYLPEKAKTVFAPGAAAPGSGGGPGGTIL